MKLIQFLSNKAKDSYPGGKTTGGLSWLLSFSYEYKELYLLFAIFIYGTSLNKHRDISSFTDKTLHHSFNGQRENLLQYIHPKFNLLL